MWARDLKNKNIALPTKNLKKLLAFVTSRTRGMMRGAQAGTKPEPTIGAHPS
jgi:hypothetical protein